MNKLLFLLGSILLVSPMNSNAFSSVRTNDALQVNAADSQDDGGVIRGKISGLEPVDTLLVRTKTKTDTIAVKNGVFEYSCNNSTAELVNFYCIGRKLANGEYRAFRMSPISVLMFPNNSVQVNGNFDIYQVSGSKFYDEYNKMYGPILENEKKGNKLYEEYVKIARTPQPDKQKMDNIRKEFENISKENEKIAVDYISKHPDSQVSLFLLYYLRPENGDEYINKISQNVQSGDMADIYKEIKKYYERVAAKKEAAKRVQPGKVAPDFTLKDIKGNDFTLSSLKGKYVVLDFWGSWCGWCIKGMPKMKEMYAKYKGKLEIVGVDCNDPEDKWKAAVAKHQLPWTNVINDPKGGKDMTNAYAISGFPTKIIIAPDGKIAKVVVGEDPAFYTAIDEFMK